MGLPIQRFVAATNANDVFPEYLDTGIFSPRASIQTLSNAMDVGNPSNFARIMDLFGEDQDRLEEIIQGLAFSDPSTQEAIREVYRQYGYIVDPHGAVGYLALKEYQLRYPGSSGVVLGTAHPAKFKDTVEETLGISVELPEALARLVDLPKESVKIAADFEVLKDFLLA